MNNILFNFLFIVFFVSAAVAQIEREYTVGKIYPGYYVTLENDTVHGYIKNGNNVFNQNNCEYFTKETDSRPAHRFKPNQIKEYRVSDRIYRSMNYSGGLLKKPLRFVNLYNDGAIAEYVFYSEDREQSETRVLHKANDPDNADPVELSSFALRFSRRMSEYIADYPELAEKVSNREDGYGLLRLMSIIEEYNEWYINR